MKDVCIIKGSGCSFAVWLGLVGFFASMGFIAGEYFFEQMSSAKSRKHYVLVDLGFSGFWAFMYFVGFCYISNQWSNSADPPNGVGSGKNSLWRVKSIFLNFCPFQATWHVRYCSHSFRFSPGVVAPTSHSFASKQVSAKFHSNRRTKATLIRLPTPAMRMRTSSIKSRPSRSNNSKWVSNNFRLRPTKLIFHKTNSITACVFVKTMIALHNVIVKDSLTKHHKRVKDKLFYYHFVVVSMIRIKAPCWLWMENLRDRKRNPFDNLEANSVLLFSVKWREVVDVWNSAYLP